MLGAEGGPDGADAPNARAGAAQRTTHTGSTFAGRRKRDKLKSVIFRSMGGGADESAWARRMGDIKRPDNGRSAK